MNSRRIEQNIPKGRVDITSTVLRNSTGKREPSSHFTKTLHHGEDGTTSDSVTEQDRDGTSLCKGTSDTEEETSSDSTTKGDELDVPRLQAPLDVAVLFSSADLRFSVSIDASGYEGP
jgi:hypothetical protein